MKCKKLTVNAKKPVLFWSGKIAIFSLHLQRNNLVAKWKVPQESLTKLKFLLLEYKKIKRVAEKFKEN